MKKLLFVAALASVAFTGCVSNEDDVTPGVDSKLSFAAPLVHGVTRAYSGEIANPYPTEEHFVVNAKYYTDKFTTWAEGTDYMVNVETKHDATANAWAPMDHDYYWPKTGTLTFSAFSPADYDSWKPAIAEEKLTASGVVVAADAADVDLLYSELAKDKTKNDDIDGNNYKGVEIKFAHALSSIKFKVALISELTGTTITVNEIKLAKVASEGDFSWDFVPDNDPVWTGDETKLAEYVAVTGSTQTVTTTAADVADANALILLPQTLGRADAANNVVAVVKYTITVGEQEGIEQIATIDLSKLTYATQDSAEWKPGKRYIYTVKIGLDRILFDPEVNAWVDVPVTE